MRITGTFLLLLTSAIACNKKKLNTDPTIEMGNTDQVNMVYYYALVEGTLSNPDILEIDFDQDGLYDIRLMSEYQGSTGVGVMPIASIECLHNKCSLEVFESMDTTFYFETFQLTNNPNTGEQMGIISTTYSCRQESPMYMIDTIQSKKHLKPKEKGNN